MACEDRGHQVVEKDSSPWSFKNSGASGRGWPATIHATPCTVTNAARIDLRARLQ